MTELDRLRDQLNSIARESPEKAGELAFPLFIGTGPRLPVRPAEQEVHEAAVVRRVDVGGRELAVYRWGEGEGEREGRVLLLHGVPGRASNMAHFVTGLRKLGMTAVAFDFFGNGDSGGDRATILDVAEAVRAVAAEHGPFHAVIAHSFGGLCAFHALRDGLRAERLVTIGAVCDFAYLADAFCARLGLDPGIEDDLRRRSEEFFLPETDIWERFSATHRAQELTSPLLVIHDENDKEIAVAQGRRLAAAYPHARYVETTGLGHRRIIADEGVVAATLEFIAE